MEPKSTPQETGCMLLMHEIVISRQQNVTSLPGNRENEKTKIQDCHTSPTRDAVSCFYTGSTITWPDPDLPPINLWSMPT